MSSHILNVRPQPDQVLVDIADYVMNYKVASDLAYETARNCLIDTLGCGLEALEYPACTKLLGPVVQGTVVPNGAKVPGTQFRLDPVQAAFNIGALIRWLMPLALSMQRRMSIQQRRRWLVPETSSPSGSTNMRRRGQTCALTGISEALFGRWWLKARK